MKCPNCNETDHEPTAKYCHVCGVLLEKEQSKEPPVVQSRCRFEWAESFSEGLAMVGIDGKAGFIDKTGNLAIAPKYNNTGSYMFGHEVKNGFSEGMAAVSIGQYPNVKYGCIDHSGNFVIQPQFDCIWPFSEGLAPFRNGDLKWGFIDKTGRIVIQPIYENVCGFSEGLASVELGYEHHAFIDKTGRIVLEKTKNLVPSLDAGFPIRKAGFSWALDFNDGWACVECFEKKGYIDKTGKFVRMKYDSIHDFSEGLACFSVDNYSRCGFIDRNLRVAIEPRYGLAGDFHNGRAVVYLDKKAGFIDTTGRLVIPCRFDKATSFQDGMAAVEMYDKVGFIDMSGNMVIPPRFSSARAFSEGFAAVEEHGHWGFIDKTGNYAF